MSETKTSYLSPASATLEVSAVRSLEPSASITLDLGIPFTVFSIKFPIPEEKGSFPEVAGEALGVMLDEMAAFMLSTGYRQGVIAKVYALAMECYRGMQGQEAPEEREATIGTVRGEFPLPTEFVNETQKQVVTAASKSILYHVTFDSKVPDILKTGLSSGRGTNFPESGMDRVFLTSEEGIPYWEDLLEDRKPTDDKVVVLQVSTNGLRLNTDKAGTDASGAASYLTYSVPPRNIKLAGKEVRRVPRQRRMEFTSQRPTRPSKGDVLRAIRRYRFQSIKNTPRPLYLVVYDQMGNPKGTLSLGPGFHNDLLKMQYGKAAAGAGRSLGPAMEAVKAGGGIFRGIGEDGRGGELVYFDNPANKSTLVLGIEGITPEAVRRKIEWNSSLSRRAAATCEFCKAPSVGCVVNYAQPGGPFLGSAVHVCEGHREQGEDPRASQAAFVSNRWERRPGESRVPYPEFSKRKEAGQWGERSYDGDMVHDILDKHRPSHREKDPSEWLGFDEPVPPDEVPAVLGEIKGMDRGELDAKQQYVGVVVFLVEHGSEVPQQARLRAAEVAEELSGLTVGMGDAPDKGRQQWKHPEKRKARLRREVAVLRAGKIAAAFGPVYHGTPNRFEVFRTRRHKSLSDVGDEPGNEGWRMGAYFTDDPDQAERWASPHGEIKKVTLEMRKPLDLRGLTRKKLDALLPWLGRDDKGEILTGSESDIGYGMYKTLEYIDRKEGLVPLLKKDGYDGIIMPDSTEGTTYVAFYPRQIKKEGRFLRIEEVRAWGRGEQDEYYAQHPELGRTGKPKQSSPVEKYPGERPVGYSSRQVDRLEPHPYRGYRDGSACYICGEKREHKCHEAVEPKRADYWDEQGYWAGAGHAASGVLPVCTSTGRVCLAWRSPDVDQGSCWGTIGGAVKEGMDPASSARHELAEETGYRGSLSLHPAHTFKSGKFSYHNYIGEVGHEFGLRPEGGSAWETEALEWGGLDEWLREAKTSPGSFHPGVLALLRESGGLIRSICEKAEGRKAENGEQAQAQAL